LSSRPGLGQAQGGDAPIRRFTWKALVGGLDDPYPIYHQIRSEGPVVRGAPGQWLVTTHAESVRALRDGRTSVDPSKAQRVFIAASPGGRDAVRRPEGGGGPVAPVERMLSFIRMDPPDHTRLRNAVSKVFTARAVQDLRPLIQRTVDDLLDQRMSGELDVVSEFAYPLSVTVISHLLGIPPEDRSQVARWSEGLIRILNATSRADAPVGAERAAMGQCRMYFQELIARRQREPRDDLVSSLIGSSEKGRVSPAEVLSTVLLLLVAGHETSVNLISNGTLALLRNRDQLDRLREDPGLIESAVEELLRYDSPVQILLRFAVEDTELGGRRIRRGSTLVIVLGAANRDPEVFADPDTLDLGRRDNRHIAFGGGIHYCLGSALARLEGQVAIGSLVQRRPGLALASDRREWRQSLVWRGLERLPVRL
jgi:cytochrome P450